jgi:hypothetical protein
MLTPVRVRGRRNRRQEKRDRDHTADTVAGQRRRKHGRPMISFDAVSASQASLLERRHHRAAANAVAVAASSSSSSSYNRTLRKVTGSSTIERLPVELIEKIFLYALDINFARASPALAAAISSERIYRALILLAFWDDSSAPPASHQRARARARVVVARALRPADYTYPLTDEQRTRLQSSILQCRWCTRQRVQARLPELMQLTIQKHWYEAGVSMDAEQQGRLDRFLARRDVDRTSFEGAIDQQWCRMVITPLVAVDVSCAGTGNHTHRVLGLRHIPDRLLRGGGGGGGGGAEGFSEDDDNYLEMLRHQYTVVDHDRNAQGLRDHVTFSRHALHQGIQKALQTHNPRALTTLLKIDEFSARRRLESSPDGSPHSYYALPPEHFRTAVRVAGHDPTFFQLLLRANAESVPPDDPDLTQWAMDLQNSNDHAAFGHWLLDFMMRLPSDIEAARADPRRAAVFVYGESNPQAPMARRYLEDVLHDPSPEAGLSNWIHEISYDVSTTWTASI